MSLVEELFCPSCTKRTGRRVRLMGKVCRRCTTMASTVVIDDETGAVVEIRKARSSPILATAKFLQMRKQ